MVNLGFTAFGLGIEEYVDLGRTAEQVGFRTMWMGEHVLTASRIESPYPYTRDGAPVGFNVDSPLTDTMTVLAFVAAATTSLRVATGVLILPLRHPVLLARAVSSLQALSKGRFILGVGTGWMREEYDALGVSFERRGRRMDESLAVVDLLLRADGPVSFAGSEFTLDEIHFNRSHRHSVPVYVAGSSPAALERAARFGDGWYCPPFADLADIQACRRVIDAERRRLGRSGEFTIVSRVPADVSRRTIAEQCDIGITDFVIGLGAYSATPTADDRRRALEHVSKRLLPAGPKS